MSENPNYALCAYAKHSCYFAESIRSKAKKNFIVKEKMIRFLSQAFFSRVGDPIIYSDFDRDSAIRIAVREVTCLIEQVYGAKQVVISHSYQLDFY